jgi:hypothetical protein
MKKLIMFCLLSIFFLHGPAFSAFNFVDNGNGTVTDARTGLVWLKNANPCGYKNWYDAGTYCANLTSGQAGLTDGSVAGQWRLPSKEELEGIGTDPPAIWESGTPSVVWTMPGAPFTNVQSPYYWSGSHYVSSSNIDCAWYVYMSNGNVNGNLLAYSYCVWPVRELITTTTTTIPQGINDGLVAYYPFNDNFNDESGNGNNGTIYGNPQFVNGAIGNALQFDGIDDYMHSASLNINTGDSFTVSYWMNFSWQQSRFWILYFGYDANAFPCSVPEGFHSLITGLNWSPATTSGFGFMCGGGNNAFNMANFQGQWIHVVTTYDSLNKNINSFINAISMDSQTVTQAIPMQNIGLYIGQAPLGYPDNNNFKGTLDDIRIYNRALSEAEILQLYNLRNTSTTTSICDADYWKNLYEQTKAELDACKNPTTTTAPPTNIELSVLDANPSDKQVILKWKTETETDNAGFNVWRADNFVKVNDALIPALGSSVEGKDYDFVDQWVLNGKRYFYLLEDIDTNGISTFHGPVKAVPRWVYGIGK